MHAHDTWTLLLIDRGVVRYHLDGQERTASPGQVTLLPPRVPHDGGSATSSGFRKRVIYLDGGGLDPRLVRTAVRDPARSSAALHRLVVGLHARLVPRSDPLDAEQLLVSVLEAITRAWAPGSALTAPARTPAAGRVAEHLRELLDADIAVGVTLQEAAATLQVSRSALVHAFRRRFGMSPHQYLISRRLDLARALLLDGAAVADTAVLAGFHDQAHLSRHFKRLLGMPPGAWVNAARAA